MFNQETAPTANNSSEVQNQEMIDKIIKSENPAILQFYIEIAYIDPIKKIIEKLKTQKFSDRDIKYLNKKLEEYTNVAVEVSNLKVLVPNSNFERINQYTTEKYLRYFNTLLNYFNSLII